MIVKDCTLKPKGAIEKTHKLWNKDIYEGDLWPPYCRKGAWPLRITESLRDWNNAEFTLVSTVFYLLKSPSLAH